MLGLILLLVFQVCLSNAGKWLFRSILKRVGNYYLIGERSEGSAYFILFPTNLPQTIFVIGW